MYIAIMCTCTCTSRYICLKEHVHFSMYVGIKPRPIVLKFLPIMLLSNTQKIAYYAHDYCNYMPHFVYDFID